MNNLPTYSYRVVWSDKQKEYIGLCYEFPSLSWCDKDLTTSFYGIRRLVEDAVREMRYGGEKIPKIRSPLKQEDP